MSYAWLKNLKEGDKVYVKDVTWISKYYPRIKEFDTLTVEHIIIERNEDTSLIYVTEPSEEFAGNSQGFYVFRFYSPKEIHGIQFSNKINNLIEE